MDRLTTGIDGVSRSVTIEITFVGPPAAGLADSEAVLAEGVVRLPDDTLRAFSGWMELLAVLEQAAVLTVP